MYLGRYISFVFLFLQIICNCYPVQCKMNGFLLNELSRNYCFGITRVFISTIIILAFPLFVVANMLGISRFFFFQIDFSPVTFTKCVGLGRLFISALILTFNACLCLSTYWSFITYVLLNFNDSNAAFCVDLCTSNLAKFMTAFIALNAKIS